jgi:probable phosphoglycerate mutase
VSAPPPPVKRAAIDMAGGAPPEARTTLFAIRHGETLWNAEGRFQGHGDSPLTETGRRQAAALGERLRGTWFDALICSDLGRAVETAAIIAGCTGHAVASDRRLRERNYGVLEGLSVDDIRSRHGQVLKQLMGNDPDYVIPRGESHRQHYQRNVAFIEELLAERSGGRVAIIAHGGVLDSIFRLVAALPLDRPRCFIAANASLSIFAHGHFYGTARWVIETWGDVAHLNGPAAAALSPG